MSNVFSFVMATMLLTLCFAANAFAQSANVRVGLHSDYDRVVFDFDRSVQYDAREDGLGAFTLTFSGADAVNLAGVSQNQLQFFNVIERQDAAQGVAVRLEGVEGTSFRHFRIGSKVIVDVSGPKLRQVRQSSQPEQEPRQNRQAAQESNAPEPARQDQQSAAPASEVQREPAAPARMTAADFQSASVITVSSTRAFGLSAFTDNGMLWIVTDQPDMAVPPQVEGDAQSWLGPVRRSAIDGGTVFRYAWPEGAAANLHLKPEGGGLLWRLTISAFPPGLETASLQSLRDSPESNIAFRVGLNELENVLRFTNQDTGQIMHVATVSSAESRLFIERQFVDFHVERAVVGAAFTQIMPGLDVRAVQGGNPEILISNPENGLAVSEATFALYETILTDMAFDKVSDSERIYFLSRWSGGGISKLTEIRRDFEKRLSQAEESDPVFVELILSLAKLHLANFLPQEALGYFEYAGNELRGIKDNVEFMSLEAAAQALAGHALKAERNFNKAKLNDLPEVQYWKAYNYGRMERWEEAAEIMPEDPVFLSRYPRLIKYELGLILAETALRQNNIQVAGDYVALLQSDLSRMKDPYLSAYRYLLGELRRQEGDESEALAIWEELLESGDRLYRAKAGLAWVKLARIKDEITPARGIEILDQLRYTWRGDGLETQIAHTLGRMYLEQADYRKGLSLLRETASFTDNEANRAEIVNDMQTAFRDIFLGEPSETLSAIQAVTLYEAFSELLPAGAEGNRIVQALVDRLIDVDLIERASSLLEQMIATRLSGEDQDKAILKVAKLKLYNQQPDEALAALRRIRASTLRRNSEMNTQKTLIEAKARAERGQTKRALSILSRLGDAAEAEQLKADIAWEKGEWREASDALLALLSKRGISVQQGSLENDQAELVLNTAVALNLAGENQTLQAFQARYQEQMSETEQAGLFQIVTRPPGQSYLSGRETLLSIVEEVDLFSDVISDL